MEIKSCILKSSEEFIDYVSSINEKLMQSKTMRKFVELYRSVKEKGEVS